MIGSPTYTAQGIVVTTYFNPSITFWSKIRVESDLLPAANKTWYVLKLSHIIDAEVPRGNWISRIEAVDRAVAPPIPR